MMLSLYEELCAAQEQARERGAGDAEVTELRREIINRRNRETTGAEYAHQWSGARQLPPEPDEPEQRQMNFAPRKERKGDRF